MDQKTLDNLADYVSNLIERDAYMQNILCKLAREELDWKDDEGHTDEEEEILIDTEGSVLERVLKTMIYSRSPQGPLTFAQLADEIHDVSDVVPIKYGDGIPDGWEIGVEAGNTTFQRSETCYVEMSFEVSEATLQRLIKGEPKLKARLGL